MTHVNQRRKSIVVDGIIYDFPKSVVGKNITVINEKIFIDGYEFIDGKWKRTLRALWHKLF